MQKIILASRSPQRQMLLKKTGIKFIAAPSYIKENLRDNLSIEKQIIFLALNKAKTAVKKFPRDIIIAADTVAVFKNKIIGKPKGFLDAQRILLRLNNTKHYVYTAIIVINAKTGQKIIDLDKTIIFTRKLSLEKIKKLAAKNHDKAGCYAIQKNDDLFIKKIKGDFYNVVGLPIGKLIAILKLFK